MHRVLPRILSVFFALAGISKLIGWLPPLERFYQWQLPGWWMVYAVGVVQLLGGAGLWRDPSRRAAAFVLAAVCLVILSAQVRFAWWWDGLASVILMALLLRVAQVGSTSTSTPPAR